MKAIFWHEWRSVWLIVFRWAISISEASIILALNKRTMMVNNTLLNFIYSEGYNKNLKNGRFIINRLLLHLLRKSIFKKVISISNCITNMFQFHIFWCISKFSWKSKMNRYYENNKDFNLWLKDILPWCHKLILCTYCKRALL